MEKIQELTDKLYREGVEKGNAEGMRLVEKAKAEADKLVADARKEADEIVDKARKQAQELDANTKSELKLYAGQALNALKSEIVNVVSDKLVKDTVKELMGNKDFMGNFMVAHAKDLLDKGVKIEKVNGKAAAFSVSPSDGSYKVNFGEEEFAAYFKDFLRPKLIEMLF